MGEEKDKLEQRKAKLFGKLKSIFGEDETEKPSGSAGLPDTLEARKKNFFSVLLANKDKNWIYYLLLLPVFALAWFIRTRNLPLLQGKYLIELDSYFFYRYAHTILEKGALPVIDYMRYSPLGFQTARFAFFPYTLVYLYKIAHIFSPSMSQIEWHIIYPPVITIISFIIFFLFVKEIFNSKVALISTAFLAVIPAYIYRTGAGFADHEAMAMLWMFLSLYFFALMWKSNSWKKSSLFGCLSGLFAAALAATWGGSQFLSVSTALFIFAAVLLTKIKRKQFIGFLSWYLIYGLSAGYFYSFTITGLFFTKFDGLLLGFSLLIFGATIFAEKYKEKLSKYTKFLPLPALIALTVGLAVGIVAILTGVISLTMIYQELTHVGIERFRTTVSESQFPYFLGGAGWWDSFSWSFILLFLGSAFLCFKLFEGSKKISALLSSSLGLALFFFIVGRYKQSSSAVIQFFDKTYLIWFFGFIALVLFTYVYFYNKNRNKFESIFSVKWGYLLLFSWLMLAILMSRTQIRLLFALVPPAAIAIGYFVAEGSSELFKIKPAKVLAVCLILFAAFAFYSNATAAYSANKNSGSSTPGQWESAMTFLREQTPENSVIAHWWDYGYWTQTVGNRTTVGDGGNNIAWDNGLGRYIMTSTNISETLEYAKTHKVTHILYSDEEIGKYHAFSLIGSDENLDRLSTIGVFGLQNQKEVRNGTQMIYSGGWSLDKDYAIGNLILPEDQAYIIGFSFVVDGGKITEPKTYIYYNNQQLEFGINCIYAGNQRLEFESNNSINGCLVLVPYIKDAQNAVQFGGAFWVSEKAKDGLFARLYLFNESISYFKEVYNDKMPLALYGGNLIGPIRIWEIQYPAGVKTDDKYLETSPYG